MNLGKADLVARIKARLASVDPAKAKELGGVYLFNIMKGINVYSWSKFIFIFNCSTAKRESMIEIFGLVTTCTPVTDAKNTSIVTPRYIIQYCKISPYICRVSSSSVIDLHNNHYKISYIVHL